MPETLIIGPCPTCLAVVKSAEWQHEQTWQLWPCGHSAVVTRHVTEAGEVRHLLE
ncbi:hypothetical protein GCM10027425_09360 [Alteromonas gracilis]